MTQQPHDRNGVPLRVGVPMEARVMNRTSKEESLKAKIVRIEADRAELERVGKDVDERVRRFWLRLRLLASSDCGWRVRRSEG